jgi:hypothetical protein
MDVRLLKLVHTTAAATQLDATMFTVSLSTVTARPTLKLATPSRKTTIARAVSYETMSGYMKSRCAAAKTAADWQAIEKDAPGAKAAYEAAQAKAKATVTTKVDPMDALCADDPSAVECKAFD